MYAIVDIAGQQFKVEAGMEIFVNRLAAEKGAAVEFEKTGAIRELRARKTFLKPSVKKRMQMQKAIYVQQMQLQDEQ